MLTFLGSHKAQKIHDIGGIEAWNKLSEAEQSHLDLEILRSIGRDEIEKLPPTEQRDLQIFIRTGCCMHKDLNTVKGGDKALQESWEKRGKARPILLANKDNTAVLSASDPSNLSAAEKRAAEVSKRGATHVTLLGGMIFKNKDTKKGQHDTYSWWMEKTVGHPVPFADVSNTRYGSHGDAACLILVY